MRIKHFLVPLFAALTLLAAPIESQRAQPAIPPPEPGGPSGVFGLHGVPLSPALDTDGLPCALPLDPADTVLHVSPWPGGTVPFRFDANVNATQRLQAEAAMAIIESLAQVDFIVRTSQSAFLHIQSGTANFSTTIGYSGSAETIELFNWNTQGIVIHELMHALGFYHEQCRTDRNSYVTIVTANIEPGTEHNFAIAAGSTRLGPYDFGSLMHYSRCALTVCGSCTPGCETILAPGHEDEIGQRSAVSALDAHGIRSLYPSSNWRFVDKTNSSAGSGTGTNPWRELSSALSTAPSNSTVFVMPGTYDLGSTWSKALVIAAPVGGVIVQ
jgi:hypothetical protein